MTSAGDPPATTSGRNLSEGIVTFLFTDIEGSTRLLRQLDERYVDALAAQRRLFRAAVTAHGGVEVDTQGDAFFVAFPDAAGAVAARLGSDARDLTTGPPAAHTPLSHTRTALAGGLPDSGGQHRSSGRWNHPPTPPRLPAATAGSDRAAREYDERVTRYR